MDARVNDFLDEINQIAPLNENKEEPVWEKCYDEYSGYHYYWNIKTNEVTWDMPLEYKPISKSKQKKLSNLYIPPRSAPLFPSASNLPAVSDAIKIYKIGEHSDTPSTSVRIDKSKTKQREDEKKKNCTKPVRRKSDSDDEKIVLISSYADSESEDEKQSIEILVNDSKPAKSPNEQTDVTPKPVETKPDLSTEIKTKQQPSGFSLVAGYSDSDDDSASESEIPQEKIAHSTLFPITKPIDIKDFESPPKVEEDFDSKAFQRKKRIGVALVNTGKKTKTDGENERKGLGFSGESNDSNPTYPGFKSGGVMFVKADVLNPSTPDVDENENAYKTLKEKLGFLSEGREEVSPVQVMLIQLETLYTALKSGDLKRNYLAKWLDDTCSDLVKLEKEAAPEGWLLQWDRSHKRYYYQNAQTGESQWEYPQADVTVCDEAMDICTTPPPNGAESTIHMSPPLPPNISSPSPPPPPIISHDDEKNSETVSEDTEPLPPGVDVLDATKTKDSTKNDLNDVLNSFYSDIAAIETTSNSPVSNVDEPKIDAETEMSKKKKKKVKLTQGIAMKKKGVSKLVEKWKSVQLSLND